MVVGQGCEDLIAVGREAPLATQKTGFVALPANVPLRQVLILVTFKLLWLEEQLVDSKILIIFIGESEALLVEVVRNQTVGVATILVV